MKILSPKVLVGVPSMGSWNDNFGMSLMGMYVYSVQRFDCEILNHRGSCLSEGRQTLAERALQGGFTHLLMVDTDQTFRADLLVKLVSRDVSVVACNIATKKLPPSETAVVFKDGQYHCTRLTDGLEKVTHVGTGVMLVKTKVFNVIPRPWFPTSWDPDLQRVVGEDWGFCNLLGKAGIPIWVDHDVSRHVGHEGLMRYSLPRYHKEIPTNEATTFAGIPVDGVGQPSGPDASQNQPVCEI